MKKYGFTLLEITLVIVILSILAGSILATDTMLRNSEMRGIVNELENYHTAINLFEEKYKALPGDMINAETHWGSDAGCPNTAWNAKPHTATCNGNGDGKIASRNIDTGVNDQLYESFRAWQHLSNAGFLNLTFAGMSGDSGSDIDVRMGENVPQSYVRVAGYLPYHMQCASCTGYFPLRYGNILRVGKKGSGVSDDASVVFLTPGETMAIDKKIDDGIPSMGKLLVPTPDLEPGCATSTTPASARYTSTTATTQTCSLIFVTGY